MVAQSGFLQRLGIFSAVFVACVLVMPNVHAMEIPEPRVALVIGNADYQPAKNGRTMRLKNPVNDARAMAVQLRSFGFDVIEKTNLRTRDIRPTLTAFSKKLEAQPSAVALVFYAGHGVQISNASQTDVDNYFPAIDARVGDEPDAWKTDLPTQSLSLKEINDVLRKGKTRFNLLLLDACRDNPYLAKTRALGKREGGLAAVKPVKGTLLFYAASPGQLSKDNAGTHGLFTSVYLENMLRGKNEPIENVNKEVVAGVSQKSRGEQVPSVVSSLEGGNFCFDVCVNPADDASWRMAQRTNSREAYQVYLDDYPSGRYVAEAKKKLQALSRNPE